MRRFFIFSILMPLLGLPCITLARYLVTGQCKDLQLDGFLRGILLMRHALIAFLLLLFLGPASAQQTAAPDAATAGVTIPDSLRYIFDLPWCKRWDLACVQCQKRGNGVQCVSKRQDCTEEFKYYYCSAFNLPKGCVQWRNGCNTCTPQADGRIYCTLAPCDEYLAPNRPSFVCLRSKEQ
jgi:hypothetical protein